jgi:hypothetical protein
MTVRSYESLSPFPDDLSDAQLQALIDYARDRESREEEQAMEVASALADKLRRPGETEEEHAERVPSHIYRHGITSSDVSWAAKSIREREAEAKKWENFGSVFWHVLNNRQHAAEAEAFESQRALVEVGDPVDANEAYAALGCSPPDQTRWSDGPTRYEYRSVSLDEQFIGYVRRKPKQSFWSYTRLGDTSSWNEQVEPRWNNGGYGQRYRHQQEAADGLVKAVLKARQAVSA